MFEQAGGAVADAPAAIGNQNAGGVVAAIQRPDQGESPAFTDQLNVPSPVECQER
jgi:hypothetical protein